MNMFKSLKARGFNLIVRMTTVDSTFITHFIFTDQLMDEHL